jgi:hypothetical protein
MAEKHEPSLELPSLRWRRSPATTMAEAQRGQAADEVGQGPATVRRAPAPTAPARRQVRLPAPLAAAVTGLLVGLAAVGLVRAGQAACERLSGTSACGGGLGLLVLAAIVVMLTLLGAALLRALGVARAGSTSTLAVALATVACLLLFADVLLDRSGAVVVVLVGLTAYAVAQGVTAAAAGDG